MCVSVQLQIFSSYILTYAGLSHYSTTRPTMNSSLSSLERGNPPPRGKACASCAASKRRCDLKQPACTRCSQRRTRCRYPEGEHPNGNISDIFPVQDAQPLAQSFDLDTEPLVMDYIITHVPNQVQMSCRPELLLPPFVPYDILDANLMSSEIPMTLGDILPTSSAISTDLTFDPFSTTNSLILPISDEMMRRRSMLLRTRLKYSIEEYLSAPRRMVYENSTPWSHPLLYRDEMPNCMQDAQACCALYLARNSTNASFVMRTLSTRAAALIVEQLPSEPLGLLARTHALLLYSILRMFHSDASTRLSAACDMVALEEAAIALFPHISFPDPDSEPASLSLFPLDEAQTFWSNWIFQESARRTFLIAFFFLRVYRLIQGDVSLQCDGPTFTRHTFTISAQLWGASDVVQFTEAWNQRRRFLVTNVHISEVIAAANPEDIDSYGKMLMTVLMGMDQMKEWMVSRGGRL